MDRMAQVSKIKLMNAPCHSPPKAEATGSNPVGRAN
jgi:hypothetical protein